MYKTLLDQDWTDLLASSIVTSSGLAEVLPVLVEDVGAVIEKYPMRINSYFLSLILKEGASNRTTQKKGVAAGKGPLWQQAVPNIEELDQKSDADPLWEEAQSPLPNLIHRYPDRVVFMVSNRCAMYCRHCMRKRRVGDHDGNFNVTEKTINEGIKYITSTPSVKETILSGGDPLMLSDKRVFDILNRLNAITHLDLIRIHTRVPSTLPQRITPSLVSLLKGFHPIYINIQFNHPDEITPEATLACSRLADAGIPLGSQTVLLKGVNDDPEVMMHLMRKLLTIRVRPYYLHHGDPVCGTLHFRTSVKKGLDIMETMRGRLSGIGVPHYMIDLPEGGGKVPLLPAYVRRKERDGRFPVKNYLGKLYDYPVA